MPSDSIFFPDKKYKKNCEDVLILKNKDKIIEIYGEEHNKPLPENPKDNSYVAMAEKLNGLGDEEDKPLVLVEHTDAFCNLENLDEEKINFMRKQGGSETIFLDLKTNDYPKIECMDNRYSLGLLTGQQEFEYEELAYVMAEDEHIKSELDIDFYLSNFDSIIISQYTKITSDSIQQKFVDSIYVELYQEYLTILNQQVEIFRLFFFNFKKDNEFFSKTFNEATYWYILIVVIIRILTNFKKIGSLVVDLNILERIHRSDSKHIILYTGLNHAYRIAYILADYRDIGKDLHHQIIKKYDLTFQKTKYMYLLSSVKPEVMIDGQEHEQELITHLSTILEPYQSPEAIEKKSKQVLVKKHVIPTIWEVVLNSAIAKQKNFTHSQSWIMIFLEMDDLLFYIYVLGLGLTLQQAGFLIFYYDMEYLFKENNPLSGEWKTFYDAHFPDGLGISEAELHQTTKLNPDWSEETYDKLNQKIKDLKKDIQEIHQKIEKDDELQEISKKLEDESLTDDKEISVLEQQYQIKQNKLEKSTNLAKLSSKLKKNVSKKAKYSREKKIPKTEADREEDEKKFARVKEELRPKILEFLSRFLTADDIDNFFLLVSEPSQAFQLLQPGGLQESAIEIARKEEKEGRNYADDFAKSSGFIPYTETPLPGKSIKKQTRYEIEWWKHDDHLNKTKKKERDLAYLKNKYGIVLR